HVRQQAQAAAQVQQRHGGALQGGAHTWVQRNAAQLGTRVEVVVAVAQDGAGQERGGDAPRAAGIQRCACIHGPCVHRASASHTAGRSSAAHSAYIAAEGCRPSAASIAASPPRARLTGAMSTQCAPARSAWAWHTALKASICAATCAGSRPSAWANGVTPQSG